MVIIDLRVNTDKQKDITYVFGMAGLTGNTNLVASSIQYVS